MENRAHALMAGLFTIGLVLALVGVVIWFGQHGRNRASHTSSCRGRRCPG